jgi:hypothetical protein
VTAAALVAVLAGCGGGDAGSAPDNASTEDFCDAYLSMLDEMMTMDPESDDAVTAIREWGEKLEEVGTPEDIPDDARDGFEVILEALSELDEDSTQQDLEDLGGDLSAEEEQASEAFGEYVTETCPMEMPEMPDMDDLESEMGEPTESP